MIITHLSTFLPCNEDSPPAHLMLITGRTGDCSHYGGSDTGTQITFEVNINSLHPMSQSRHSNTRGNQRCNPDPDKPSFMMSVRHQASGIRPRP